MIQCDVINKRKSIRLFDQKMILRESEIWDCLEAATKAPSPHNSQPWRFRVILSKDVINDISMRLINNRWMKSAPAIVIVGAVKSVGIEKQKSYLAIGAAIENILLEAQQRGIATCWIGECIGKDLESLLAWPADYEIVSMIAMGYGREYKFVKVARKPVEASLI